MLRDENGNHMTTKHVTKDPAQQELSSLYSVTVTTYQQPFSLLPRIRKLLFSRRQLHIGQNECGWTVTKVQVLKSWRNESGNDICWLPCRQTKASIRFDPIVEMVKGYFNVYNQQRDQIPERFAGVGSPFGKKNRAFIRLWTILHEPLICQICKYREEW